MNSARFIKFGLFAFVVLALLVLVLSLSPFNPFASGEIAQDITPTRVTASARPTSFTVRTNRPANQVLSQEATAVPSPTEEPGVPPPTIPANASDAFQQAMTLRRNGDYVRAATAFRTALRENPEPALARQAQFRLGESLYLALDFTNAVPALEAVITENDGDDAATRAHYYLADIFTQQQKYEGALEHLRVYRQRTRALMGIVDGEIGDVLLASGDSAGALNEYEAALGDAAFTNAQRVATLKKIAEVHTARGEPAEAAARLGEAFPLAPDDATRASVEFLWGQALYASGQEDAAIAKWKHTLATYTTQGGAHLAVARLVELGVEVNELQRGIANYSVGSYDLAIQAFRRYIASNEVPGAEVLYYAGLAYQRKGDPVSAIRNFDVLLQSYPNDRRAADAMYGKAVSQIRAGNITDALATLRVMLKEFPNDTRTDDGFWNSGLALESSANHAPAAAVFAELARTFPASNFASNSLFNGGVNYYLTQDYTRAEALWRTAIQNYPTTQNADAAAFWLGKLKRLQGDEASAGEFFRIAAQAPRTYYSWRALDALNQPAPPPSYNLQDYEMDDGADARAELEQWIAGWSGAPATAELPAAVLSDGYFRRGSEYASLSRPLDARPQFQTLNENFKGNAAALYALALYYKDTNYFSLSMDAARKLADLSKQTETQQPRLLRQLVYPTYFADLIVPYAERHGFDPMIFFGLVRQESGFNPLSFSSAAARGLTQVIPGTGEGIARALNVQDFEQNDLFKPYVSVRFGTFYLADVLRSFNGNVYYALMGYNGGPGNAKKWQKPDLDVAVEGITLSESYVYVRTVIAQYRQYTDVYRGGTQ